MNIVLFGDSLFGRFNKNLLDQLESHIPSSTVYNCAAGGLNSIDSVRRVDYIAQLQPDYVFVSLGANDCAPWKEQVPLDEFAANIEKIIQAFNKSKVIMLLCPAVHLESKEQTDEFNELLSRYNAKIKELCDNNAASYVDVDALLKPLTEQSIDFHAEDGMHLNQDGYDLVINDLARLVTA